MNYKLVIRMLGTILILEAALMLPSLAISLCCGAEDALALTLAALITLAAGLPMRLLAKPESKNLRAREGFVIVGLAWLAMSLFGALPFLFSGFLPDFFDALFESVSGFTTTGATMILDFSHMPMGVTFWRSFTHWIGGMGVLVLTLAIVPQFTGRNAFLVLAESPGPSLSKVAPKMRDSSKILYLIYAVLSLLMFVALLFCGLNPYDAAIQMMGTAGTGGFSNYAASVGAFNSPAVEIVVTVFMTVFGMNLSLFYALAIGRWRDLIRSEELRWYLLINLGAVLIFLTQMLPLPEYNWDFGKTLRHACFQTATISSTSGFGIADLNVWPIAMKTVIVVLMFCGSCTGSTAGGMKTMRIALLFKQSKREIQHTFSPRRVNVVRFEGHGVDEKMLHQICVFGIVYAALVVLGGVIVSFEGHFDLETNFSAALTCISNVGPGFGGVSGSFAGYGSFSKVIFSMLMLAGRLEIFPILILFHPNVWRGA